MCADNQNIKLNSDNHHTGFQHAMMIKVQPYPDPDTQGLSYMSKTFITSRVPFYAIFMIFQGSQAAITFLSDHILKQISICFNSCFKVLF